MSPRKPKRERLLSTRRLPNTFTWKENTGRNLGERSNSGSAPFLRYLRTVSVACSWCVNGVASERRARTLAADETLKVAGRSQVTRASTRRRASSVATERRAHAADTIPPRDRGESLYQPARACPRIRTEERERHTRMTNRSLPPARFREPANLNLRVYFHNSTLARFLTSADRAQIP